jgi:outer membrane biosynthesis protein TonB
MPTETPTEPTLPPSTEAPAPAPQQPVRIVAGRHGELEAHELIHLLDSIEDERARGRFRESLYISIFVWAVIAWFLLYGQRRFWPPKLINVANVHEQELTDIRLPPTHLPTPAIRTPPPAPHPTIDSETMKKLTAAAPAPTPLPPAPVAQPAPPPPPPAPAVTQPRLPQPVPEAPTAQTKPNFNTQSSAGSNIQNALNSAARNRGGDLGGGSSSRRSSPLNVGGVDVLSDTQNVDFNPYLRRILGDIKRNWDPLIPTEAEAPLYKQGESYIRFTILPDGSIKDASMHLDGSTHDEAINRSCWGSITSEGQFPPLPKEFHGPEFELRIHFLVNKQLPE